MKSRSIKLMMATLLLLCPAAGWFVAPYVVLALSDTCEARSLNVYREPNRDVITRAHWWFSPGGSGGSGTYSAEVIFKGKNEAVYTRHVDRTYEIDYHFAGPHLRVETTHVTRLRGESEAGEDVTRYTDPLVIKGFTSPGFIFVLPGNNYLFGLNGRPRTFCQPAA